MRPREFTIALLLAAAIRPVRAQLTGEAAPDCDRHPCRPCY